MVSRLVRRSLLGMGVLACTFVNGPVAWGQKESDRTQLQRTREAIHAKLNEKRVTLDVTDRPLKEVAAQLAEMLDIPIRIDARGLDDVGQTPDELVTFHAADVRAGRVLRRILREFDLAYRIDQHGLEITTPEETEWNMGPPLIYPVEDLIYDDEGQVHADALARLIAATLTPESWECLGGPGTMKYFGESLVVLQTETLHRQLSQLLGGLRSLRQGERENPWEPITLETHLGDYERVLQRIRETVVDMPNQEYPLDKLRDELSKATGLAIWIDARALEDVGLTTDTPIQGPWKQVTVQRVLDEVSRIYDLDWIVDDGIVLITTPEEAEADLVVRIYPVDDLIEMAAALPPVSSGPMYGDPYDALTDLIASTVQPELWADMGGPGELAPFPPASCLVISQIRFIHEEIEQLLSDLRASQQREARENRGLERKTTMILRTYFVPQTGAGPEADLGDLETVRRRIRSTIEPQAWEEDGAYIDVYQGRIVVHQRAAIHRQIDGYLRATGFYEPKTTGASPKKDQDAVGADEVGASGGLSPPLVRTNVSSRRDICRERLPSPFQRLIEAAE